MQDVDQQQETEQKVGQAHLIPKKEKLLTSIHGTMNSVQELKQFILRLKRLLKMERLHISKMEQRSIG